ncbi:ABC transporter substrate-binding protein [Vibrio nigripulchritudo]|uniref:ABC transporter substrate-binding protein n=1 Tax=Vibrio nigripulchritudo TaxID=28173 RepID=UPI0005F9BFA6|nr:ABC transporter substrate-binding protein [Vibrio nigripulchritudo]KJY80930.1 sugar ABC transporter substrate-binding protein [Vibrio nigripulchritudo]
MKHTVKVATLTAILGLAAMFSQMTNAAEKLKLALIPGVVDPFYFTMHRGAQHAADAIGADLAFQVPREWNTTAQVPILNAIIAKKPDAILISPVDKQQLIAPLKQAADAGIRVITVDTFIDDGNYQDGSGPGDFVDSYIASDNVLGGRIAARALAKSIGYKGKVYVASVKPGISTTDQRAEGFMDEMKRWSDVEVLKIQYNEDDSNKSASQLQAVYARNPDLAGVFGANTFSALGAAEGVKKLGKVGEIKVVAFDALPRIVQDIKSGLVDIAVAQQPATMGYYGVMTAHALLTGQAVPTHIGTGFVVMDKSNIDSPDIRKYVYSD